MNNHPKKTNPTRKAHLITILPLIAASSLLMPPPLHSQNLQEIPPSSIEPTTKLQTTNQKTPRDWEKNPPINDSEVIRYEQEKNIPIEERFETIEKRSHQGWYRAEAIRKILHLCAPTTKKQIQLLQKSLKALENERLGQKTKTALQEETLLLFEETFPDLVQNPVEIQQEPKTPSEKNTIDKK
jgi:hypothetical protein